jgi:TIR domain
MPLSPSERIVLIKEISDRLAGEDWPLVDVTLKQFGLPWADQWSGSQSSYVLQMVQDSPDETLLDLAQHVGFQFAKPSAMRIEPPFWQEGMFRLFVSHLAIHRSFVGELQEGLVPFGISCFVAHTDIEPTQIWQTQIETALATCDALVALLHEGFHASKWTDQEIGFAMGRGVPAFAVRFGETPYGFIGRFQAFNGNSKAAPVLARELFDASRKNKETQSRMGEVLVGLFATSRSFADAKTRLGYLEDLTVWEASFSTRIRSAADSNSQIQDSWGVPQRVEALVQKWAKSAV